MSDDNKSTTTGISRRSVTKGLAWSVPVVTVASAAPAFAASGGGPTITPGLACKNPGNSCKGRPKGYGFNSRICNTTSKTLYICAVTITSTTLTDLAFALTEPPLPIAIAPGQCVDVLFNASSSNSANLVFTATISVTYGHNADCSDTEHAPIVFNVVVNGTPPNCPCPPTP